MERYRKMLIAIDGSDAGFHAFKESFKLADSEKSWLTAVCVTPPYDGDLEVVGMGNVRQAISQPCMDTIEKAKAMADKDKKLVKFIHETGSFHEAIIDVADESNCELIVMGRHGRKGLASTLIGSVAARVIGYSRMDVLIVPPESSIGWDTVLVATDGSDYGGQAVDRAIDFATSYKSKLKVASVVDVPIEAYAENPQVLDTFKEKTQATVDRAVEKAKAAGLEAEGFVRTGDSGDNILELATELSANTIFISSHGRTGIRRLLLGSVAEKIIGLSKCPVLVAK